MQQIEPKELVAFFISCGKIDGISKRSSSTELQKATYMNEYSKKMIEIGNNYLNKYITVEAKIIDITESNIKIEIPNSGIPYSVEHSYGYDDGFVTEWTTTEYRSTYLYFFYQTEEHNSQLLRFNRNSSVVVQGEIKHLTLSGISIGKNMYEEVWKKENGYKPFSGVVLELSSIEKVNKKVPPKIFFERLFNI